jgi:serine protease Do
LALGTVGVSARAESPALETARHLNDAFVEVADQVSPAVVVIEVAHRPDYTGGDRSENPFLEMMPPETRRRFEEHLKKQREQAATGHHLIYDARGSGIVLREDGWILTNDHVVEGAEKVRVRLRDGAVCDATKWLTDPQSDLAVVKVEAQKLAPARLGNSAKIRVGEFAIAIGAPFDLDYSVTFGHVSATGRSHVIPTWIGNASGASLDQDFIQTDASINPGNSGGPLVNINGEVIGVNTLVHGFNRGVGFAVPVNMARQVADHLIADGKFTRAWLGVQINALSEDAMFHDLVPDLKQGVVVRKVVPDSPAARAGLQPADVIVAVESAPVATAQELRGGIRVRPIGSVVKLDVARPDGAGAYKTLHLSLRTESWPEETLDRKVAQTAKADQPSSTGLGLTVQTLTPTLAEKYGVTMVKAVVITDVEPESPAARERLQPGDVITQVNRKPVPTQKDFRDALQARAGRGVLLDIISDGAPQFRILKDGGD